MSAPRVSRSGVQAFARAHNLAGRLNRAAVESAVMAVFVAALALNIALFVLAHREQVEQATVHARIAADNSAAAVLFEDRKAAAETLGFLRDNPEVLDATIFDLRGEPFARYQGAGVAARGLAARFGMADRTRIDVPLLSQDKRLGRVSLTVTLNPLWERLATLTAITLAAGVLGVSFAVLRVARVRRAVRQTEHELDRLAFYDQVTGLHNRHAAKELLEACVKAPQAARFTVALLDLDDFKLVNDTLGHKAGDDLLRSLGMRLQELCGEDGTVFRLGGDEFVILWERGGSPSVVERLGQRMVRALSEPVAVGDRVMFAKASVGLATFPAHGASAQELLRAADTAMYHAKAAGKNTFSVYDPQMGALTAQRLKTSTELALAMEQGELVLHYQPIVDLASRALIGVEALVRWQHPERGLLNAAQFIDIAEESGLVAELGGWVLQAAARQQRAWTQDGLGHLFIAVNVSAQQFKRKLLLDQVEAALALATDPGKLQIELTEHALIEDVQSNVQCLRRLQAMGLAIAIDDFGTGLSSLAYLKRLPIDKLKIDRSFVNDICATDEDRAIVRAVVSLSHALKLQVVAEGIENEAQLRHLRLLGVDHGQGYYFSRPVSPDKVPEMAGGFGDDARAA